MNFYNKDLFTKEYFEKAGKYLIYFAVVELIFSLILLFTPQFGTEVLIYTVGFVALFGGIARFVQAFASGLSGGQRVAQILLGIIYIIAGVYAFTNTVLAFLSLTLVFGFILIFEGFYLLFSSGESPAKGLSIFNGIITLLLGVLLLFDFPESAFIVPFYFGFSLLFNSITLFTAYSAVKKNMK